MATAKERWGTLSMNHEPVLMRARDCAALTIPSILPPLGHDDSRDLPTPFQSIGAQAVNNISSRMLLALFPAGTPAFRLVMDDVLIEEAGESIGEYQKRLSKIESTATLRFETSTVRPQLGEALSNLVVTGNYLVFYNDTEDFRGYRLDQYRVRRDGRGKPVEAVVHYKVSPSVLPEETIAACEVKRESSQDVEVYILITWDKSKVSWFEEINGKVVPGSDGDAPVEKSPWMPLRWKAVPGQHYGRGMVEEYLGDLRSLEGISEAIVSFAAAAAKVLWLVAPNSTTDPEEVANAESGDVIVGKAEDLTSMQLDKYADFQVAANVAERIERRLAAAFLLTSASVRDAERVTAEEVQRIAQELEDVLGGVYTVQSQELQLPFIRRHLAVLTRSGDIPALPKGTVEPVVVAGFQALGRNHSLNKLRGFIADVVNTLTPEVALQFLRGPEIISRLGVGWGVEGIDEIVKTQDEVNQEQSAARESQLTADMASKAAGPMASALAKNGLPQ